MCFLKISFTGSIWVQIASKARMMSRVWKSQLLSLNGTYLIACNLQADKDTNDSGVIRINRSHWHKNILQKILFCFFLHSICSIQVACLLAFELWHAHGAKQKGKYWCHHTPVNPEQLQAFKNSWGLRKTQCCYLACDPAFFIKAWCKNLMNTKTGGYWAAFGLWSETKVLDRLNSETLW